LARPRMILFFAMALVAFVAANCASGSKDRQGGSKKRASYLPKEIPANLLPTMAVGVDESYVFVRPDGDAPFFGPLRKGENIKKIDVGKSWILVWIPRLRISGWVRKHQVYPIHKQISPEETIPTKYLTILHILKKRVNIRKAASTRARIVYRARQRQEYLLLDEKRGWYQIWVPQVKKKGWVAGKLVVKQDRK
jgi:hypothetical protein